MPRVTINRQPREVDDGLTILQALRRLGIEVPSLCDDDRLHPFGGCRVCVVRVDGAPRPVAACTSLLAEGMDVETHPPDIESERRALLELLAREQPPVEHPHLAEKPLVRWLRTYQVADECRAAADPSLVDDSHPLIRVDMSRCIYCYRCVRICNELQGQGVWRVWQRGADTRIRPDGPTLLESSCVSCGACVDTCPSGALEDRSVLERGVPTVWTRTTCAYCGTGCEMRVGTRDGAIAQVVPVGDAPVSRGHLCVKGRYAYDFATADDRIVDPLIREHDTWRIASWEEALDLVAERLGDLRKQFGPDSIGILGSARATNEENYLAQKFARVVIGTNNVDCCARVCHTPSAAALKAMLGTGASTNVFDDIEVARTILVCGANPTENHPIVGARIRQAVRRGARLIVIDPRATELATLADVHLAPRPGTNVPLFNALAHVIVAEQLHDEDFVAARVDGWPAFVDFVRRWPPERAADLCDLEPTRIREAARLYATARPSMSVHGLGLTEHGQGTESVMCLINLALMTGNIGRPGSGVNPLRGQNNVQGSAMMGCDPSILTGGAPIASARSRFEAAWQARLPERQGWHLMQMIDEASAGRLRGLWVMGYDVFFTNPQAEVTRAALGRLDFVVVQDLFLTETARTFASVFLPAASSFEKHGTFMNAERRIQRVRLAIPPPGRARSDQEIISEVAARMGHGTAFDFASAQSVWDEIRRVWPDVGGITYARLERGGLCWPCPTEDHPGTSVLYQSGFPVGRASLRPIDYRPSPETLTADYPFLLTTGRTLYQFNAGTMTRRSRSHSLFPTDVLGIAAADAERLHLQDGERVILRSRYGHATLPVARSSSVRPGQLFATFHDPTVFLNRVTGPHRDAIVGAPEYKVTAVSLERAETTP
jgi:formate dehydrogenase major subunit